MEDHPVLSPEHRAALGWFDANQGREVGWSEIVVGTGFPITTQKGIYKPAANPYVLSIRQALGGEYGNRPIEVTEQGWSLDYFQEGHDPAGVNDHFTNRALFACRDNGVPLGVIVQVRRKPAAYRIQGVAQVVGFRDGWFRLQSARETSSLSIAHEATILSTEDARRRINAAIVARQGSGLFRAAALRAYGGRCAISDYDVEEALEAAHIVPYLGPHTNTTANSILLRADLHTLFDRQMLDVDPSTLRVRLSAPLRGTAYSNLEGRPLRRPTGVAPSDLCKTLQTRRSHLLAISANVRISASKVGPLLAHAGRRREP